MTAEQIVRAAIPDAPAELCEHILWARTPFPVGRVTARELYRAAAGFHRAAIKGVELCDFCERALAPGTRFVCAECEAALCPRSPPSEEDATR
jgi:hypothetical protein